MLPPVDIGWQLFKTVSQVIEVACNDAKDMAVHRFKDGIDRGPMIWHSEVDIGDFLESYYRSLRAAKDTGWWEGDMRHEAVVVPFVRELEGEYGFMWKQDNNGTTFVVTPDRISHYAKFALEYRAVSVE